MNQNHRVVIVGGGFAGMNAALELRDKGVEVTLIDKRNFHLFQPLLYQVATGGLSPGDITAPLRRVLKRAKNVRVLMAEVTDIDVERQIVAINGESLGYDTLILACGAENHYFGNDSWERYAPGLKTIEDATEMRRRILSAFESAEREPDEEKRRAWLRFVVVGAGPTGVELAGAISEIARDTLRGDFRRIRPEESQILLIEGSPRVLPPFPADLSAKAEKALIKLGVRPRTGVKVTSIDEHGLTLRTAQGEERIESRTVLWAAGVKPSPLGLLLAGKLGAATDRAGRVIAGKDLSIPGHPECMVIGDLACLEQDGKPVPGLCPAAIQQGRHAARVVIARLRGKAAPEFRYQDRGTMATIGRNAAVVDAWFGKFDGWFAWFLWLFVHLLFLVGFQNRLLVAMQWGFQYFTFNRGARLITGKAKESQGP